MKLGFTGTREGMSEEQKATFYKLVHNIKDELEEFHYGLCKGADDDACRIVREICPDLYIGGHPSNIPSMVGDTASLCTEVFEPKPPLERNVIIVNKSSHMIATPKETTEQQRGGTWHTIRESRKNVTPVIVVWPSGKFQLQVGAGMNFGSKGR